MAGKQGWSEYFEQDKIFERLERCFQTGSLTATVVVLQRQ